ncbi:MAG: class I SAM-dependent methyltransferase [Elusimicrobia bacterium]|nr:class I SAM-dependent methyltransferase [Elusimicrobiota bacterium]
MRAPRRPSADPSPGAFLLTDALREEMSRWLAPFDITIGSTQWRRVESYLGDVERENLKMNLTSDSKEALLLRHIADGWVASAALRRLLKAVLEPRILDLGAGAGFVGVAIKIACPEISVSLMESSEKKFRFLNWAAARAGLPGLRVLPAAPGAITRPAPRAGGNSSSAAYDAVLVRAVAPLEKEISLALPFAREDAGLVIAFQTKPRTIVGMELLEIFPYRLPRESSERHLVILRRSS